MLPINYRKRLLSAGFAPLPLNGKNPVLKEWQKRHQTSAGDLDIWERIFPQATNTGALTALMPTLDIDILDAEAATAIENMVRERFEDGGYILVRFGRPPKRAIPFRTQEPFEKITAKVVGPDGSTDQRLELLGAGQQLVVGGIHPDTGKPYAWFGGEPGEIQLTDLPYIDEAAAKALVNDAVRLLHQYGYTSPPQKQKNSGSGFDHVPTDWADLIRNIHDGHTLHDSLRDLAAKLVTAGMAPGAATNFLRDLLQCSDAPRGERFNERYADIPRAVATAADKFRKEAEAAAAPINLPFIDMTDWDTTPVPPREWAVRDRIPLRQPTLFSGEGAVGKTLIALQLAVAHVTGRDWLATLPEIGPAIYVGAEDEAEELHRRLADIAGHYDIRFAEMADLHLISLAGKDALLGVADRTGIVKPTGLFTRLHDAALEIEPKLIVLDTVSDIFAGNENDRAQVRQFVALLRGLAMTANAGVLVLSHPSLTGINSGTGLSGSTGWHNSVRARMYLRPATTDDGEQPDTDLRELQFLKNNYGPLAERVLLRWQEGIFRPVPGASTLEKAAADAKADNLFLDLLERFSKQGRDVGARPGPSYAPALFAQEPEAKTAHIKKDAMADAMRRLFAGNRIHVEAYGRPSRPYSRLRKGGVDSDARGV